MPASDAGETAAEHLRNALTILRYTVHLESDTGAIERRIELALERMDDDVRSQGSQLALETLENAYEELSGGAGAGAIRRPIAAVALGTASGLANLVVVCDDGAAFMWAPPIPTKASPERYRETYERASMMGQLYALPHEWCPYHQAIPGTRAALPPIEKPRELETPAAGDVAGADRGGAW